MESSSDLVDFIERFNAEQKTLAAQQDSEDSKKKKKRTFPHPFLTAKKGSQRKKSPDSTLEKIDENGKRKKDGHKSPLPAEYVGILKGIWGTTARPPQSHRNGALTATFFHEGLSGSINHSRETSLSSPDPLGKPPGASVPTSAFHSRDSSVTSALEFSQLSLHSREPSFNEQAQSILHARRNSLGAPTSDRTSPYDSPVDDSIPLPPGWEKGVTPDGLTYFINHVERTTT
eukprot:Opistho-1_new@13137